ncbi:hypothetical protein ABPG72_007270 [Tetrahymena utriculariae]
MLNIPTIKKLIEDEGHVFESHSQEQGNFGCVIFTHLKDHYNEKYAIKVFDVDDGSKGKSSEEKIKICQAEAQAMTKLKHKNVVKYHSEKHLGLFYFILMERCQSSLQVWSDNNQTVISDQQFISITIQILDGLEFIHQQQWVLRDLKPANILIDFEGQQMKIKLCDFGAARCYPQLIKPKSTQYFGSPTYTPPEVLNELLKSKENVKQSKEGDIWAFGICLSTIGKSQLKCIDYVEKNWVVPKSPLLTPKAQQLVQFILIQDPSKRPKIKDIRQKLNQLFKFQIIQQQQSQIQQIFNEDQLIPLQMLGPQYPINPEGVVINIQQPIVNQNEFVGYFSNQINSPVQNLFKYIYDNFHSSSEINDENLPGKSEYIWIIFLANIICYFILVLLYSILTRAQNVTLVALLWVSFVVPLISNIYFLKNKKFYFFWILIQSIIMSFLNLALSPQDPVAFNIAFAAYQILILIKLLYFIKIPFEEAKQPFCYLILIYPIFLQLQYSSFAMLVILVFIFELLLFSVLLHLWGINKKDHLQGIYVAKQILNLMQNILVCIFYSLGLIRNEDLCAAFLLNIIGSIICSLLHLKIQISDTFSNSYYVIPKIIFLFNSILCYIIQFCSNGITAVCLIKIFLSFIIILSYVFLFQIEENKKRNKSRIYFETLFALIFLVLDIVGLAVSYQTGCSQGVAIFATLLSLDTILILINLCKIYNKQDSNEKDMDSIYIPK